MARGVSELYGAHSHSDIYVIGTGPSLRVFPVDFFEEKTTIGLNLAWQQVANLTYAITIHPDLNIPEFMDGSPPLENTTWIVKREKLHNMAPELIAHADENFYFFGTNGKPNTSSDPAKSDAGRMPQWLLEPTGDYLYLWTTIAQPAVNLAANLGAQNVILVGCDNAPLLDNHHATGQHTMWKGGDPLDRYREYYEGMAEVRRVLRSRGVNVVSLTPFVTVGDIEGDFARLCDELDRPTTIDQVDISSSYVAPWEGSTSVPSGTRRGYGPTRATPSLLRRVARRARRR